MASSVAQRAVKMAILRVLSVTFLYISPQPPFRSWTWLSSESQWNIDFNDILSARKDCQLFTHESNTFLGEQYVIPSIQTNGGANARNHARNSPFPSITCNSHCSSMDIILFLATSLLSSERKRIMLWNIRLDHLSVCRSLCKVNCGEMVDWIRMPFAVVRGVGWGMGILDYGGDRQGPT